MINYFFLLLSLLGLDVIAYDSNYNRLNSSDATTIFLYEELKKNNNFKMNVYQPNPSVTNFKPLPDDSLIDSNQVYICLNNMSRRFMKCNKIHELFS
jgi:hypothetical protein